MFNNLPSASVTDVTENDLNAGFALEDDAAGADDKKKNDKKDNKADDNKKSTGNKADKSGKGKSATASTTTKRSASVSDIPSDEMGDAFDNDDDEDEDDEDAQADDDKKKPVKKKAKDASDEDDENDENEDDENDEDADADEKKDDEDNDEDTSEDIKEFLKARVSLLLNKGEWKPFEIDGKKPTDIEWDEDTFADIELQQRAWQRQELKDELLDSFGPYGRDIAEYAANGGDPDKLIEIFQEQQRINIADISTEDGQKAMVLEDQTKVLGKSVESANRFIKNLIADKELEAEATETKTLLDKNLEDQAEALKQEAEDARKNNEKALRESQLLFTKNVTELVNKADDISVEEKQQLIKVLTKFDKPLKNGAKVNEFYFKFAEFKKDLPNYINLVRLVLNPGKFMKSLKNNGKTEVSDKVFKMSRTANSKKKVKTSLSSDAGSPKKSGFRLM